MKYGYGFLSRALMGFMLASSVLLGGCATTGSSMVDNSVTSADPRLTQGNDAKFFSTSGLTACAAAAGVGVLACAVSNSGDKTKCMVVAGIAACGVAMGANYYYDHRRSQYANTAERLKVMGDEVRADTEKVAMRTNTLQQVINDDKQRIADLKKAYQAKTIDRAAAQKQLSEVDANLALMRKDLAGMRNKAGEYQKTAELERQNGAGRDIEKIDAEITKMNSKVVALQKEVDGLYSQRSAITLG